MTYQAKFKRYEIKYRLTQKQKDDLITYIEPYMNKDQFYKTTIRNLYFDTDNYRLIRNSIDKPKYKEKLRLRTYKTCDKDTQVFVELKKKYKGIVYKRRLSLKEEDAMNWLIHRKSPQSNQIVKEIDYFLNYYEDLKPKIFLSYDRLAFKAKDSDLRITFDDHILFRDYDLSLRNDIYGHSLLDDDIVLMEVKTTSALPLWFVHYLSQHHIYKMPFSKYGTVYKEYLFNKEK